MEDTQAPEQAEVVIVLKAGQSLVIKAEEAPECPLRTDYDSVLSHAYRLKADKLDRAYQEKRQAELSLAQGQLSGLGIAYNNRFY